MPKKELRNSKKQIEALNDFNRDKKKIKMNSMTNFETYYLTKFRQDINQFFSTIPDQSKFHEDNQNKQTLSIQYERLTREFDHMNFLSADDKVNFGVALFFTV